MKQAAVEMLRVAVVAQVQAYDLATLVKQCLSKRQQIGGIGAAFPTVQQHG